jgi:HPt (histidine-containing phosphotransfer) domain-containing protein
MEKADAQTSVMDVSHYRTMKDALGDDFAALIADFFADCSRYSAGLTSLAEAGDADGFRELSHELKGASALLGFSGISACAAEWETMAKEGKLPDTGLIRERFPRLVEETRKQVGQMP